MYRSGRAAIDGFSKNLYEGIGGRPDALFAVLTLYLACFALPWAWVAVSPGAGLAGVAMNLALRALLARRFGHPAWTVVAHLLGVALIVAVGVRSWAWSRAGQILWRGRVYAARSERAAS